MDGIQLESFQTPHQPETHAVSAEHTRGWNPEVDHGQAVRGTPLAQRSRNAIYRRTHDLDAALRQLLRELNTNDFRAADTKRIEHLQDSRAPTACTGD
jgi:hypothetical protein